MNRRMVDSKKAVWFAVGAVLLGGLLALQQAVIPAAAQESGAVAAGQAAGGGGSAVGRRPANPMAAKIPETIEDLLEQALRSNPEVIVAEAKVREAQAELNQARLKVTLQILSFHSQKRHQQTAVEVAARYAEAVSQRVDTGTSTQEELHKALLGKVEAESALSQSEAQIRYLLGLGGELRLEPPKSEAAAAPAPPKPARQRPPIPEKFKQFLQTQVVLHVGDQQPLQEVLEALRKMGDDKINFAYDREVDWTELNVKLEANEIPMESVLLMIHDLYGMVFVFRDYGILVTNDAVQYSACATIPADHPVFEDSED